MRKTHPRLPRPTRLVRRTRIAVVVPLGATLACAMASLTACGKEDVRAGWESLSGKKKSQSAATQDATALQGAFTVKSEGPLHHVSEAGVWKATFTTGARTVTLAGPSRTFREATARDPVMHAIWVRSLPKPFAGEVDADWLRAALVANGRAVPDHLGIGMQYIAGAMPKRDAKSRQIAGDASYGPLGADGVREIGSDVEDYLRTKAEALARTGVAGEVPDTETTEDLLARRLSLDCSGFIRMVFGFRDAFAGSGYAKPYVLSGFPNDTKEGNSNDASRNETPATLPRTAENLFLEGPGIVLIDDTGDIPSDLGALRPGDLLFFRADDTRDAKLDHVGIYLGLDAAKKRRFLSSRKSADGPTLGDFKGASILDGTGLYARAFRAARRF